MTVSDTLVTQTPIHGWFGNHVNIAHGAQELRKLNSFGSLEVCLNSGFYDQANIDLGGVQ
ncbi:MAG: hypothetical protein ACI87E_002600 [Mariniblastus sp.]|jgi:hypothetical protein